MSMHLEFEPHSWYMGFAIKSPYHLSNVATPSIKQKVRLNWQAFIDNGMTGYIDVLIASTQTGLKQQIKRYHLKQHNSYGERIARSRLDYLRAQIDAETISYDEAAELQSLADYIDRGDMQLLEWSEENYQEWLDEEWEKRNGLTDREDLETEALRACSAENTYDLRDTIDSISDENLLDLISCHGDYSKELTLMEDKDE